MEKTSNDFINLSNLPSEIQQHIAAYLEAPALGFFALSDKQRLKNILPLLVNYQARFPLLLTGNGGSTYLTQANQLFGCGNNSYGQLGLGDKEHRSIFTAVPWPEERGRIEQVIAGGMHTIVLTKDNRLWVCGDNYYGQLRLGNQAQRSTFSAVPWPADRGRIRQVIAGGNHTIVLTKDNRLWVCGLNCYGQLGLGDNENRSTFTAVPWPEDRGRIEQVIVSGDYTVVLTHDNRLWMCGNNEYGQLGLDDQAYRLTFTAVLWPVERGQIRQVIAGGSYTVVLTQDNRLWGCGVNSFGQLGLGDKTRRATFTLVKALSEAMQQVFTLNNHLNQLIKLGTALTRTPGIDSNTHHSQCQSEETEGQQILKKMRL